MIQWSDIFNMFNSSKDRPEYDFEKSEIDNYSSKITVHVMPKDQESSDI